MPKVNITERGVRPSCLGPVLQLKLFADGYPPLAWADLHAAFTAAYPGRWAVQVFPPRDALVDGKCVYHLFAMPEGVRPEGLDLRG